MAKTLILLALLLISCRSVSDDSVSQRLGPEKSSIYAENVCKITHQEEGSCKWQVRFSPNGGAEKQVIDTILSAKDSLYMLSYSFTSDNIAKALVHMKNSNVHVEVILDPSNKSGKGSDLQTLLDGGVITYIDSEHAIAHNKTVVKDLRWILTGSFNFTSAAEKRNAENSLLLECPGLAKKYLDDWNKHKEHSTRLN